MAQMKTLTLNGTTYEIFDAGAARQETVSKIDEALDSILQLQNTLTGADIAPILDDIIETQNSFIGGDKV